MQIPHRQEAGRGVAPPFEFTSATQTSPKKRFGLSARRTERFTVSFFAKATRGHTEGRTTGSWHPLLALPTASLDPSEVGVGTTRGAGCFSGRLRAPARYET